MEAKCMRCKKVMDKLVHIPRISENIICTDCARKEIPNYDEIMERLEKQEETKR